MIMSTVTDRHWYSVLSTLIRPCRRRSHERIEIISCSEQSSSHEPWLEAMNLEIQASI
jgi:hypothetical protein